MSLNSLVSSLNEYSLQLTMIFTAIIVALVLKKLINSYIKRNINLRPENRTSLVFLNHSLSFLLFLFLGIFVIYNIPYLKALSVSLFAGAGILVVIIGLASQQAFSNIVSGIFIVIFKPFRVGDRIEVSTEQRGVVEDITLRHTVIRNFENKRIIVPNSLISSQIIVNLNIGDDKICRFVDFGISFDSDVEKAISIMKEECENHPLSIDNRTEEQKAAGDPKVTVRLINFGDSSVNLRAFVWAADPPTAFKLGSELNISIKKRFDNEGIEIPFPYRTLVFKNQGNNNSPNVTVPPIK
ncbi:MAG: mechanosensitive ion channel family protein [Chitinophagaceae bacterium]|nr:MAG: mechanosensitive ion channel family protein [Chitinophagaceae bacterium]